MKAWITKYKRWLWWGAGMLALCAGVLLGLPAMMEPVPQEGVSLPVLTTTQEVTELLKASGRSLEEERKADRASLESCWNATTWMRKPWRMLQRHCSGW